MMHFLVYETYLSRIKGSVGSKLFRHLFVEKDGKKKDLLKRGNLSCAMFVSSILKLSDLIETLHATVDGTIIDMEKSGWKKIDVVRPGCVILWEVKRGYNHGHPHIGFALNEKMAISNSSSKHLIVRHHLTYGTRDGKPVRDIVGMFWHEKLEE